MQYKSYLVEQNLESIKEKIILFFGENLGLINEFKNKIKKSSENCKIIRLSQEEILKNNSILLNEITNLSLFEEKKILFINNTTDKILEIVNEIEEIIKDQKIYFFADVLDKRSKLRNHFETSINCSAIACYNDNELGMRKLIQSKLKEFSGLSPYNISLILDSCNLDRTKLSNEISKIYTFFEDKKLDTEKLERLLNLRENDDFNKLKDEALLGNRTQTNKLLADTLLSPEKNALYLNTINQRLVKILEISKNNEDDIEIAVNKLKPPIFWKDKPKVILQAKKWNQEKIQTILKKTYDLEVEIKSNALSNKNILIKKLLVDVCELANS
tara:strand:+ start:11938 stop:12924 length:987 start_codon:yes stop_codon:yes gene_type:complete